MRVDAQARAAKPDRSVLLSASAGSGKTRALVFRIIHLLSAGARPGELAAITFTEKAAAQMKDRLYRELARAAWAGMGTAELLELDPDDTPYQLVKTPEEIFSMLTVRPDALKASTVHAFCLGLLRRFPLEAGLPPGFAVMDESEIPIRRDLAADGCLKSVEKGELWEEFRTLADAGLNIKNIKALIVTALEKRSQLSRFNTRIREGEDAHMAAAASVIEEGGVCALAGDMARLLREYLLADEEIILALESLAYMNGASWFEKFPAVFEVLKPYFFTGKMTLLAKSPLTKKAAEKAVGKASATAIKERHDSLYMPLRETVTTLAGLHDTWTGTRALGALLGLYRKAEELYIQMNHQEGLVDYDDLEIYAYRLLTGPDAGRLMYRIEEKTLHYLVDEFQDTADIQWDILERLASEAFSGAGAEGVRAPTLFAVGDKKQSIYRFRQANYRLMDRLKGKMESSISGDRRDFPQLDLNFRSCPEIVTVVNEVFRELFKEDGYNDSEPVRKEAEGQVKLRLAEDEPGALAQEVEEALGCPLWDDEARGYRPAGYGDMAVLIRSRNRLKDYEKALEECGVPFRVVGGVGFFYQDEVNAVLSVLGYLENPDDLLSLAVALKSPLFRMTDPSIEAILKADKRVDPLHSMKDAALREISPEAHSLFTRWRALAGAVPVGRLVEAVITDSSARFAFGVRGGPAAIANIEKLQGIAHAFDGRGGVGLGEFIEWVRTYREKAELATADVELPEHRDFVSVMTVHAAKGLEFPVVFLPGTASAPNNRTGGLIVSDGKAAVRTGALLGDNPLFAELKETERAEGAKEAGRLLYVAMTRAKDRLVILGGNGKPAEGSWLSLLLSAAPENLFGGGDISGGDKGAVVYAYPKEASRTVEARTVNVSPLEARFSSPLMKNLLPLPAPEGLLFTAPSSLADLSGLVESSGPAGAHAMMRGALAHLALEALGKGERKDLLALAGRVQGMDMLGKAEKDALLREVEADISALIADKELGGLLKPGGGKYFELPLLMKRGTEVVYGKADLVIIEGNNARVIDYKTGLSGMPREAVVRAYYPQLAAYRDAVREAFGLASVKAYLLFVESRELVGLPE
jgi:ATP-dependent helicase/nuclease subunit A